MPALRPRLDAGEAQPDGGVDRLIIAQLEVEERLLHHRPPVAPVERIAPDEVERAGDGGVVDAGQHQQDAVRHAFADEVEGGAGEVGRPPFARAGVLIEVPEGVPVFGADVRAGERADLHVGLRGGAFLAQVLALGR